MSLYLILAGINRICITIARKHQQKIDKYHKNSPRFNDFIKMGSHATPHRILTSQYISSKKNVTPGSLQPARVTHLFQKKSEEFKLLPNLANLHLSSSLTGGWGIVEPSWHNPCCMIRIQRYIYIYIHITVTILKNMKNLWVHIFGGSMCSR